MLSRSTVLAIRVPEEFKDDMRLAKARAAILGIPLYKIISAYIRNFARAEDGTLDAIKARTSSTL